MDDRGMCGGYVGCRVVFLRILLLDFITYAVYNVNIDNCMIY